ncbi:MAG: CinA family protein [Hominimerdicola sp.]
MNFAEGDKMVTRSIDIVTKNVVEYMSRAKLKLCTAESCTGGMIAQTITDVSGASKMFLGGICSYTEEIKQNVLGVKKETLYKYTVYSPQTASEMSLGAIRLFGADASIGVTGIAGPGAGPNGEPEGTVYVSVRTAQREVVRDLKLYDEYENLNRRTIRLLTTQKALEMLLELLKQES